MTNKRGDANSAKQTVMVLGSLGIGKSAVFTWLSDAAAAPFEAILAPWIMKVYMAEYLYLGQATVDGFFSDGFLDYTRRLR